MGRTGISKAVIALAAAYAIALQGVLAVLSLTVAGPGAALLCTSAQPGGGSPIPGSDCPCAAGCGMPSHCGNAAAPSPTPVVGAPVYPASSIMPAGASAPRHVAARPTPYDPRAPPRLPSLS